ncbi:cytochrome c peroxidase [Bradyrhizobium sp. SYSU BS000235]|uniref:cytochrome c peroxidase n=1 Tax=Bradyrhizobium sp. SYSU BS000235 TaxID=3411332 RepID=UPI003C76A7DB
MFVRRCLVAAFAIVMAVVVQQAFAFPVDGNQTTLPAGSELNEDALDLPREVFHSEAVGGRRSHLVNLGDMAFNAPGILGGTARQAGISCGTCHVNGASNPKLFIPGMSTRPGNFDTTGSLFNPKANNLALDAVRIPSLRGARYLAPYGNDGRMTSLRDFVRNVIVVEFAGPEPSPAILDGLVAYIQDIDFLPNPSLGPGGKLTTEANDAERRGEVLFRKPFPHDPSLSCAGCHDPATAFLDHKQHDVGTGGLYKTPTLLNADFNAPYFHDGRYDTYDQVVGHFDNKFQLGLSAQDKADLVAYLTAVGDGVQAHERDGAAARLQEISGFVGVLTKAIPEHDNDTIDLVVDTVGGELRELTERVPDRKNTIVSGGVKQRNLARMALKEVVLTLRRIGNDAASGNYDAAAAEYRTYDRLMNAAVPAIISSAEPWSLFNPIVHDAHYAALRRILQSDKQPPQQAN